MDLKNIGGIVAGLVIAVVLLSSVLVPVISSTLVTAGDEVTLTNNTAIVLREIEDGDVLKCERTKLTETTQSDVWTLNDEIITSLSGTSITWNTGIMSDAVYMQINGASNSAAGTFYDVTRATPSTQYFGAPPSAEIGSTTATTFTFSNGEVVVVFGENTMLTKPYTWGYVVCPNEDGEYSAAVSGGTGMVTNTNEITLCGAYTSGENDTMYTYHNGTSYVSNTDYTIDVSIETEIHDGTTDIYDATVSVDIGDETFTPYRILVPYEVSGHADSGAMYSLLNIIPLLVTVGILMGIVTAVFVRRE